MQICLLVLIGEFLVVANFLEWWLVSTTVGTFLLVEGYYSCVSLYAALLASLSYIFINAMPMGYCRAKSNRSAA